MAKSVQYSEKLATSILERVADGETIAALCKESGMPSKSTLWRWRSGTTEGVPEDFATRFELAPRVRLEGFVEDLIEIPKAIDPDSPGDVQKARLACENRRWLLSKLLRQQFGDQSKVEIGGDAGEALAKQAENRERVKRMLDGLSADDRDAIQRMAQKAMQRGTGFCAPLEREAKP